MLRYLAERDIETLPSTKITLAKQKAEEPVSFLERHEVEAMLKLPATARPEGLRDRAIMATLFSSGMRIAELVALDAGQLAPLMHDKQDAERTLELTIVGKGKHIRTIFISPRAAHWIRAYLVPTARGILAEQRRQRLLEVTGRDALQVKDRDQHLQTL